MPRFNRDVASIEKPRAEEDEEERTEKNNEPPILIH
jgi:hypothetical protein